MKFFAALAGALLILGTSLSAHAQYGGPGPDYSRGEPRRQERQAAQPYPAPDRRGNAAADPLRQSGGGQRLTPDERRQLRRDIDEHGREIYGDRGQRRR